MYAIIQARAGATRLPNKMLLEFAEQQTLLQITVRRVAQVVEMPKVVVATTNQPTDDALVQSLLPFTQQGLTIVRGSEHNVLDRFLTTAQQLNLDTNNSNNQQQGILRICADNPFLNHNLLANLYTFALQNPNAHYASYITANKTPAIMTHYGIFAEYANLNALRQVAQTATSPLAFEHVTWQLHQNPQLYNCLYLPVPPELENNKWLRLTVDTQTDFKHAQKIWNELPNPYNYQIPELIAACQRLNLMPNMQQQIDLNSK